MARYISYLMQVGREGKPATNHNTSHDYRKAAHMNVYEVGVGIVTHEMDVGIQLDSTRERETRRVSKDKTVLEIFNQAPSRINRPTFKRVPIDARVEDITQAEYQKVVERSK